MEEPVKKLILTALLLFAAPFCVLAKDYTIAAGDKLNISVAGEPEYQTEAQVRPDGKIVVHTLGEISALGLTVEQIQADITTRLKEFIRQPVVTVNMLGMGNSKVYVMGGGVKPAVYDATQYRTLLSLLTNLGDTSAIDLRNASVVRDGKEIKKDFYDLYTGGDVSQDIPLMSGDTVQLPPTASNRGVYVVGAVNAPKVVTYREGLTFLEAILEAGGYSKFANPNNTKIVRNSDGQHETIMVKGKSLIRDGDMKQNVVLRGGDLIIVEESFF
jgi:polysaccharide export outer membrane protein